MEFEISLEKIELFNVKRIVDVRFQILIIQVVLLRVYLLTLNPLVPVLCSNYLKKNIKFKKY